MFLARYHVKGAVTSQPVSEVRIDEPAMDLSVAEQTAPIQHDTAPEVAAPTPEPEPIADPVPDDAVLDDPVVKSIPTKARAKAAPKADDLPPAPKVENVELFVDAVKFLKRRGEGLTEKAKDLGEGKAKPLVEQCVDAVEHLMDLFSQDESGCEAADAFIDELSEASDIMVLMQVEDGDGPAADAVTLLLQLRRDM